MNEQFADFKRFLPTVQMRILFDVGANIGQSTRAFRQACPSARIFAFEPVPRTFESLQDSCQRDEETRCYNLALGDQRGQAVMESSGTKLTNRIIAKARGQVETVSVEIDTGDAFCAKRRIKHIDFLKVDTEGHDLNVCAGFLAMISQQQIDLVQVEAGMNPDNQDHVPLQDFVEFFSPHRYLIFKLYDQAMRPTRPRLRRANVVFVSGALLAAAAKRTSAPSLTRL